MHLIKDSQKIWRFPFFSSSSLSKRQRRGEARKEAEKEAGRGRSRRKGKMSLAGAAAVQLFRYSYEGIYFFICSLLKFLYTCLFMELLRMIGGKVGWRGDKWGGGENSTLLHFIQRCLFFPLTFSNKLCVIKSVLSAAVHSGGYVQWFASGPANVGTL